MESLGSGGLVWDSRVEGSGFQGRVFGRGPQGSLEIEIRASPRPPNPKP